MQLMVVHNPWSFITNEIVQIKRQTETVAGDIIDHVCIEPMMTQDTW